MCANNIMNSVFDVFLQPDKPVRQEIKPKTTMLTIRIPEKLRDDFQLYCLRKKQRTGVKTDMSKEIIGFIYDCLESDQ